MKACLLVVMVTHLGFLGCEAGDPGGGDDVSITRSAASVAPCSASSPNFCWAGGPVQHHPKVYVIFWGPKWGSDATHLEAMTQLMTVFGDLSGRQYNNILSQYGDSLTNPDSGVHNDTTIYAIPAIDTSVPDSGLTGLNPSDVISEVNRVARQSAYQWDTSQPDSQFFVFPQQGTRYLQFPGHHFCGYHSSGINGMVYGLVRYASDGACDVLAATSLTDPTQKLANNMVFWALHEYAEMATEPRIPGTGSWKTRDSGTLDPGEVADLCEPPQVRIDQTTPKVTFSVYPDSFTLYVPYLWSNAAGQCVLQAGQEFASPDNSGSFHGKHTVQGSILGRYLQLGADRGLLGAPVSEETPIKGGAVSYFAGQSCGGGGPFGSGSALYYGPGTPAPSVHEVHGCIYHEYARQGGPQSSLGFPTSDEYAIPGGRQSDFQHGSITFDNVTGQSITSVGGGEPAVAMNGDGRLEAFEWRSDGTLWHKWQTSTGGSWSKWASLGCCISGTPVVRANGDQRLEVFARGTDGGLWHIWQTSPGGDWSSWAPLGGVLRGKPAVGWNLHGGLEVFTRGADDHLWHDWQTSAGWSGWADLGCCIISSPAENENLDGRLEIAAVGADNAAWHKWQVTAGGNWSVWTSLGGVLTSDLTIGRNLDWRLEVFGRGGDAGLFHNWQVARNGSWSGWFALGCCQAGPTSAAINILDGRLEVFKRGGDNALWHKWQVTSGGTWSAWFSLGGGLTSTPTVAANFDARLEVLARRTDGALWHMWQLNPGGSWSGWAPL